MPEARRFEVLVVGAGPAGLAAASAAAASGAKVAILDENPAPGGQIHRAFVGKLNAEIKGKYDQLTRLGVSLVSSCTVVDVLPDQGAVCLEPKGIQRYSYAKLILAVGARELFLPFPGWTLPNVMGVGGLQAMLKGGLQVSGKRVVVAGSGPLLIAVAVYLKNYGAKVMVIAEQASAKNLARFSFTLAKYPSKLRQGAFMMGEVGRRMQLGAWVELAEGNDRVEAVKLNKSQGRIQCDYLACAFGFVPNIELPLLLGCATEKGFVKVDDFQATDVENVYCAGEPTGIGGIELSAIEGSIAGYAATGQVAMASAKFSERQKWRVFARELDKTFALRDELKGLAQAETVICRCEDVTRAQLEGWSSGREAKLHTRCGMGPCQGRICGPATRFLNGWEHGSVRPPLVPTPLSGLESEHMTERENN